LYFSTTEWQRGSEFKAYLSEHLDLFLIWQVFASPSTRKTILWVDFQTTIHFPSWLSHSTEWSVCISGNTILELIQAKNKNWYPDCQCSNDEIAWNKNARVVNLFPRASDDLLVSICL
jgi:hypothetical protein